MILVPQEPVNALRDPHSSAAPPPPPSMRTAEMQRCVIQNLLAPASVVVSTLQIFTVWESLHVNVCGQGPWNGCHRGSSSTYEQRANSPTM